MSKISIQDAVVISIALKTQIRSYVKVAKTALECGLDVCPFVANINDLIHAYNAVNELPYVPEDAFVRELIKLKIF